MLRDSKHVYVEKFIDFLKSSSSLLLKKNYQAVNTNYVFRYVGIMDIYDVLSFAEQSRL